MSADTTLGIDPGTRRIGIAVLQNGKLMHSSIKTFQGKWSHAKLAEIILFFDTTTRKNGVSKIAVKIPDVLPASLGFTQVVGSLNALCERHGIKPKYFTHSEIKKRHCSEENATVVHLMNAMVRRHPELMPHYSREKQNSERYYCKLFEAVAVAHMIGEG